MPSTYCASFAIAFSPPVRSKSNINSLPGRFLFFLFPPFLTITDTYASILPRNVQTVNRCGLARRAYYFFFARDDFTRQFKADASCHNALLSRIRWRQGQST
ncbi:hypothetical protein NPIL_526851 [Nephila pilipes]|uniref:Uncharacterized protein n=1 Tax=Nephila pilipes TaxID=299642 RepID=A0A8X6MPM2_NEPPI|nr:hypothetical protein NPIL_526851 [Nephila pilipes]